MSKKVYIVNCYTCQHNGQETCKGCNTLLNGDVEPYENWELREDLSQKDQRIAELEQELTELKEKAIVPRFKKGDTAYAIMDTILYTDVFKVNILDTELCYKVDRGYNDISTQHYTRLFSNEQEAQAKLQELRGGE